MSDSMGSLPLWFQEGFAECFSTLEIEGKDKKVRLGRAIAEHVELLNNRVFMPLEKLFSVQHGSREYNEEEKQGLFYAESWAFVHYMMFDSEQRRTQFNIFLNDIEMGTPAGEAFQDAFDTELSVFQKTFEAYIQQRVAWNAFEIKTPAGLDRNKDMSARVMSEAEAETYLGDLLLRIDRLPEAETHLKKAIQLDAKLGRAQSAMGRLQKEKGNTAEATAFLKRAAELEPDNYLAHYYYASLIHAQKAPSENDWATMREELRKSITLAPQFTEAAQMLADANLSRNTDIPETVELLANALKVAPGQDYLALQLAFALTRTQQREKARPFIHSLLIKPTLDARMRQDAQSLLDYLDRAAGADSANRSIAEQRARAPRQNSTPVIDDSVTDTHVTRRATVDAPSESVTTESVESQLPAGTARIRGVLTSLECRNGVTFSLTVDGKFVKLHSSTPSEIKFTSFNSAVTGSISCGPAPGNGVPAVIVYRTRPADDSIGDPISVDFVER
jgi:tetratricopeptide (TPR) repeat protein